ncbi:MAG: FtsX-like permease family protein [Coriobacteriaceae bacterium]
MANTQQVEEAAEALFPDEHVVLHTAMLRYMGVSSDSSIWATFYGLVVVLAAVIVVACVSLIFNAFNISVAERIKQFGLLSSVGASRRQLRRAVVLEGAIVAVIGIPCGLSSVWPGAPSPSPPWGRPSPSWPDRWKFLPWP